MAISYVSRVLQPLPLVIPIDQALVQKARLYASQKFDQGVEKAQQVLDKLDLEGKDILHPEIKQHFDQQMAALEGQVNQLGGADFGDRNIQTEIAGLGDMVSNDPLIIQGEADSRAIRNVMSTTEKWKTDPKFNKFYAPQNEQWQNYQIGQYLHNPATRQGYGGPKSAVPFFDYQADMDKDLQDMTKRILATGTKTPDGLGYLIDGKEMTVQQVRALAASKVYNDPRYNQQFTIDSWFHGGAIRNDPEGERSMLTQKFDQQLSGIASLQAQTRKQQEAQLLRTPVDQRAVLQEQYDKHNEVLSQQASYIQKAKSSLPTWSADQMAQHSYQEKYLDEVSNQYAFRSTKYSPDSAYASRQNHDLAVRKFDADNSHWQQKFDFDARTYQQDYEQKEREINQRVNAATGLKPDGKGGYTADPTGFIPTELVNDPGSVEAKTLDDYHTERASMATQQVNTLKELMADTVSMGGDLTVGNLLRNTMLNQSKLSQPTSEDAHVTGVTHPKNTLSPMQAQLVSGIISDYNHLLNTGEVRSSLSAIATSDSARQKLNQIQQTASVMQLQQKELQAVEKKVQESLHITLAELRTLEQHEKLRDKQKIGEYTPKQGLYDMGSGPAADPQHVRYLAVKEAYAKAVGDLQGTRKKVLLVSGKVLGEETSPQQQLVRNALKEFARSSSGLDNEEFRAASGYNKETGTFEKLDIAQMKIDPTTHQVYVSLNKKGVAKGEQDSETQFFPVDIPLTDFQSILPEGLQKSMNDPTMLFLRSYYDQHHSLQLPNTKWQSFATTRGPALSFTVADRDGGPKLAYLYNGTVRLIPEQFTVDPLFYKDPIDFLSSEKLNTWVNTIITPSLITRYGMGADNKPVPGFKPTVADFNRYLDEKKNR